MLLKKLVDSKKIRRILDKLWRGYKNGFVTNVSKGEVPKQSSGLASYLAKYLASPPIAIRRILDYDGVNVTYYYKDHETKANKVETISVFKFIGRMVQHILPKNFQRIRDIVLQATKTLKKWKSLIANSLKDMKRKIKNVFVIQPPNYRERCKSGSGRDPFVCGSCGHEMVLMKIWHPKYGVIYDEYAKMRNGAYGFVDKKVVFDSKSETSGPVERVDHGYDLPIAV